MRLAVAGGAPLPPAVARVFISLGLNLIQGYGLTETSPIISGNPPDDNDPASVGIPLKHVEVSIGAEDELLTRGPCVMLGYWDNPEATRAIIDDAGWLHTGDQVRIENKHIYITGRLKEIIVLANGEKLPPADMEMAIALDPLFEQVMVIGDSRPYLSAILVLNREQWKSCARQMNLDPDDVNSLHDENLEKSVCEKLALLLSEFPGYARMHRLTLSLDAWTVENGLITPTLKLKRDRILARHAADVERMYEGH
jgi:long-chain acyl-CoA synthetase